MIKNESLDAALTAPMWWAAGGAEVCFRLSVTRAKTTGPPSDLVCATTAATPVDAHAGPDTDRPGDDGGAEPGPPRTPTSSARHPRHVQPG